MRGVMFLRHTKREKDGKEHRYWSIVENRRVGGGRVVQRPLLYLGSTIRRNWLGASRSPSSRKERRRRAPCRCSRKTAARGCCPTPRACGWSLPSCGWGGRGTWG